MGRERGIEPHNHGKADRCVKRGKTKTCKRGGLAPWPGERRCLDLASAPRPPWPGDVPIWGTEKRRWNTGQDESYAPEKRGGVNLLLDFQ